MEKRIDGFLSSEQLISYEQKRFPHKIAQHPTDFKKMRLGFVFPQGSPLRELINAPLMRIMEGPEWQKMAARYGLTPDLEPVQGRGGK